MINELRQIKVVDQHNQVTQVAFASYNIVVESTKFFFLMFYDIFLAFSFQELVIDLMQTIVEIVTYGDRQDPFIFEYVSIFCSFLSDYASWYVDDIIGVMFGS